MKLLLVILGLAFTLPLAFSAAPAGDEERKVALTWITCRSQVEIKGLVVHVADLATVKSLDPKLSRRIKAIEVGRFDRGRDRIVLNHESLKLLLAENGIPEDALVLRGAREMLARPASTTVSADRMQRLVERHVREALRGESIVAIRPALPLRPISVPSARFHSELRIEGDASNPLYAGRVELALVVVVDGEIAQRVALPTIVERRGRIVVARKRVPKGRPLGFDDLEMKEVDLSLQGPGVFRSIEEVIGQITRTPLVGGQPLRRDYIEQPAVIRRGDIVTVRVRIGRLEAKALCRALGDAAPGERFSLQNIESKKTVYAVAVDSRVADALIQN